jgi:thiamine biosynthesis lipoprotein
MSRRDFVKICGALTLAASAPVMMKPVAEAAQKPGQYHQTLLKMGTTVTITVVAGSPDSAKAAIDKAWAEMDRLIAVFDRHQDGTPVSELNRTGSLAAPSPEMLEAMRAGPLKSTACRKGRFDPTVLPLLERDTAQLHSLTGKASG